MGSTNKNNTLDPRIRAKCCCANNQTISGVLLENVFGSLPQTLIPHCFSHSNYLVVSEHASHAVADHHVRLVVRIKLVGLGQFLSESQGGIEDRIASWIRKDPELIMLADLGVGLESIYSLHPIPWC